MKVDLQATYKEEGGKSGFWWLSVNSEWVERETVRDIDGGGMVVTAMQ